MECLRQGKEPSFPTWLFPSSLPSGARSLLVMLLHPDPTKRPSADDALKHHWCMGYQRHHMTEERKEHIEALQETSINMAATTQMLKDKLRVSASNDDLTCLPEHVSRNFSNQSMPRSPKDQA